MTAATSGIEGKVGRKATAYASSRTHPIPHPHSWHTTQQKKVSRLIKDEAQKEPLFTSRVITTLLGFFSYKRPFPSHTSN